MHTIKSIFTELTVLHSNMQEKFGFVGLDKSNKLVYFDESKKSHVKLTNFHTISKYDTMADLNNLAAEIYEQL